MTSNQPYLLRAFHEWIVDNDLTPHIVVDATIQGVEVPQEHVQQGQIVLNVSPGACQQLVIGNTDISFQARFGGVARQLFIPVHAVQAIYARENGAGTIFEVDPELAEEPASTEAESSPTPPKKGKPTLKVVK
ncbi:ClpXP protease specificity-enhancing factor [Neptunicella marina]|uniref:ClpXP protease specificity-enhancing factor n=1 Tax=Neptunicella marina TaxID=2125989 RepID=A0A8J6IT49_9ALTE|nr:ClpXP protease specificity-enhancing factor [Neptunicella marina]MBC3765267.1 ClpXP protease specificity-enhancing factor [Neptunicella marina]